MGRERRKQAFPEAPRLFRYRDAADGRQHRRLGRGCLTIGDEVADADAADGGRRGAGVGPGIGDGFGHAVDGKVKAGLGPIPVNRKRVHRPQFVLAKKNVAEESALVAEERADRDPGRATGRVLGDQVGRHVIRIFVIARVEIIAINRNCGCVYEGLAAQPVETKVLNTVCAEKPL